MAAVQNSDVYIFPFHVKLKTQSSLRTIPLGDVNARWNSWRRSDYFYPEMIPEPDYSETDEDEGETDEGEGETDEGDDETSEEESVASEERLRDVQEENENEEDARKRSVRLPSKSGDAFLNQKTETAPRLKTTKLLQEGLIMPKKPSNPYLESTERKKLHKELKFKQKYGKNIVNQRSELQMALDKYTASKVKRDIAASRRTSLEKILEQQAKKIELQEKEGIMDEVPEWVERLQRQHMPRLSDPKTEEFYRVHAKVVSNLMSNFSPMDAGSHSSANSSSRGNESSVYSESDE